MRPKLDPEKFKDTVFEDSDRQTSGNRRRITLRNNERRDLVRHRRIEAAVSMFLDLERGWKWHEIATELGISVGSLKDLTKSEEFMAVYSNQFADLGHDPRLQAARAQLADLLPTATRRLIEIVEDRRVSPSVALKAIQEVFRLNGVNEPIAGTSDRKEIVEFLLQKKKDGAITVNTDKANFLVLESKYHGGGADAQDGDVIEGEFATTYTPESTMDIDSTS